jgi:DNA-binding IclR family transcriptional regulator
VEARPEPARGPNKESAGRGPSAAIRPAQSPHHNETYANVPIKVIGKVGRILDVFRREGTELPLSQIASASGLELSTASRLVSSLVSVGLLRYDPVQRLYSPGLIMLELSRAVLSRFGFRELAHRELIALSAKTGWQCYLAVADEGAEQYLIYIDAVSTTAPELSEIGQRRPLHSTATGKVLLAFRGTSIRDWQLRSSTPFTHTDVQALENELEEVRANGFATSLEEEQLGLCSAAAPIFDAEGSAVAAFGIGASAAEYSADPQRVISAVLNKARGISSAMRLSDSASAS